MPRRNGAPNTTALKAMSHPARVELLRIFSEGLASPKEAAGQLGLPLPNVSYHVKVMRDVGLLELKRTTPRRGAVEHHYALSSRARILLADTLLAARVATTGAPRQSIAALKIAMAENSRAGAEQLYDAAVALLRDLGEDTSA